MQTLPQIGPITRVAQQIQNPTNGDSIKPPAHRNPLTTAMQDQAMLGFAEGGEVKETPEQLMARMAAKYGTSGAAQSAPVAVAQPPAPQPQPQPTAATQKGIGGVVGLLKWRAKQIDEATGYANGGKIKGPGTPVSDSIPARVKQTGAPIAVSTEERIVSAAQDALLQKLAKDLGFPSLDAMLEAGTGQPVGPTIKSGSTAAAFGATTEDDPYEKASGYPVAATSQARNANVLAASAPQAQPLPETANVSALQATPIGNGEAAAGSISRAVPVSDQPQANINPLPSVLSGGTTSSVASGMQERIFSDPIPVAETPPAAGAGRGFVNPLAVTAQKQNSFTEVGNTSAPSSGPVDAHGNSMAATNEMKNKLAELTSTAPANAVLLGNSGLAETQALMDKWGREDGTAAATQAAIANPKSAQAIASLNGSSLQSETARNGQVIAQKTAQAANETQQRGQTLNALSASEGHGVTARGQDIAASTHAAQLAGNPLDNLLKQTQVDAGKIGINKTKQHIDDVARLNAETNPEKRQAMIENLLTAQGKNVAPAERLTLPMQRSNAEIDAARKMVAGLSQEEIRRRTAKQTNTGRENKEFDPTLEHAVNLSNRRKVGVDDHFDQRLQQAPQAQPPQGTDGDAITRFKADPAMKGHAPGKQTANGTEVLDSTGKLIGYYQ